MRVYREYNIVVVKGKSFKSSLDGRGRFNFENKDDPNYRYNYGDTYTERQQAILAGTIPLESVRACELSVLRSKALGMEDMEGYETAEFLLDKKTRPEVYESRLSDQEAKDILQSLTPWTIDWNQR